MRDRVSACVPPSAGCSYPSVTERPVLQDLGIGALVQRVDLQRSRIHFDSLPVPRNLEEGIALLFHPLQPLHHAEILDCVLEVGIETKRLSEVLHRLFVLALRVQDPTSQHQRIGIVAVA